MQNQSSAGLKAGNTKSKNTMKGGQTNKNMSQNKNKQQSGSKTSQSQKQSEVIVFDGKVRTPKRIITAKYKELTEQYLKLNQAIQQKQKKDKQGQIQSKPKSSFNNSASDSQIKNSSSNYQEKSQFMSSEKSQTSSQSESKKQEKVEEKKNKKNKALTIEDLEQNVTISLTETTTLFTLFIPSSCHLPENKQKEQSNLKYKNYVQQRIGSDNYVNRPVQTFNYQHKQITQIVEKPNSNDVGVFTANWQILDTNKKQQKSQIQLLQQDIKKNVQKEMNSFMLNPFSSLPVDQLAISIHSKYQIPGAAEYIIKEKDKSNSRTRLGGASGTANNLARQQSKSNINNTLDNSNRYKQVSSSNNTKSRQIKANQIQLDIKQQQQKVQEQQYHNLKQILEAAKKLPSEQQRNILANQNLKNSLKYVDRILNNQNYYKQYTSYRNYPEVKLKKNEQDQKKPRIKNQQIKKEEENKQILELLFKFSCKITQGYSVTSADWNPINQDLLAVAYGDLDIDSTRGGYLMFWTLKNPSFPQKIITSPSRITSCKFSHDNPNLIACGTYDGVVAIYDIRKNDSKPVAQNREDLNKHSDAVWQIQWISKGKGDKGQSLVSISADGRITQWSMKKGLQYTDLMLLRRIPQSNKKDSTQNMNFREASGLSFQFLKNQSSMYLASTEQGIIYRCSKSYTQQFLELYYGHLGPVYRVRCNPFCSDIFLSCSADWSCKIWNWKKDQALNTFQSLDLNDQVNDIQWSPNNSTLFAAISKDGRLELWDLSQKNMLDPIVILKKNAEDQKFPSKTMIRFSKGAPVLVAGDITGDVYVYRLNMQQQHLDFEQQKIKLLKLLYPNGYNKDNNKQDGNHINDKQ